jgi:hypothetical protein
MYFQTVKTGFIELLQLRIRKCVFFSEKMNDFWNVDFSRKVVVRIGFQSSINATLFRSGRYTFLRF